LNEFILPQENPYAPYWLVGDKKVYTQLEANKLAFVEGGPAYRLVFLEKEYDTLDWTTEPDEEWEELCIQRAIQLRQKYKTLKLCFSAGRDSGHVWRIFEKAGIPIDELVLIYSPHHPLRAHEHENFVYPAAVELCKRHPNMKLRVLCLVKAQYEHQLKNSDWIEGHNASQAGLLYIPYRHGQVLSTMDPDYMKGGTGYINGMEKPRIQLINGEFVFRHLDVDVGYWVFNMPNMEWFYWAPQMPKLFLKQCWMFVNHVEKNYPNATPDFVTRFQDSYSPYYDEFCKCVGRGEAMVWECGNGVQKVRDNYHWSIQSSIHTAKEQGWNSYKEWQLTIDDLKRNLSHCFNGGDPMKGSIGIWGKPYVIKKQERREIA